MHLFYSKTRCNFIRTFTQPVHIFLTRSCKRGNQCLASRRSLVGRRPHGKRQGRDKLKISFCLPPSLRPTNRPTRASRGDLNVKWARHTSHGLMIRTRLVPSIFPRRKEVTDGPATSQRGIRRNIRRPPATPKYIFCPPLPSADEANATRRVQASPASWLIEGTCRIHA